MDYFKSIFAGDSRSVDQEKVSEGKMITEAQNARLITYIKLEEISEVVR